MSPASTRPRPATCTNGGPRTGRSPPVGNCSRCRGSANRPSCNRSAFSRSPAGSSHWTPPGFIPRATRWPRRCWSGLADPARISPAGSTRRRSPSGRRRSISIPSPLNWESAGCCWPTSLSNWHGPAAIPARTCRSHFSRRACSSSRTCSPAWNCWVRCSTLSTSAPLSTSACTTAGWCTSAISRINTSAIRTTW